MKKITALLIIMVLILSVSACSKKKSKSTDTKENNRIESVTEQASQTTDTQSEETKEDNTEAPSEPEKTIEENDTTQESTDKHVEDNAEFKQTATIEETVLVDEGGIKVIAKELTYSSYKASLELELENNSDSDIEIMSGTLGYSCNSVNGMMISDGFFNCDLKAGKKAKESVTFDYKELMLYGIDEIADIELGIYSCPGGYDYIYYPVAQIKTSASESYDYDKTKHQKALTSTEMQSQYDYNVIYSAGEKLYDNDDVSIVSETLFKNSKDDDFLIIEAQNNSNAQRYLTVNDVYINNIKVYSSTWTSELINPSKSAMIDINLSSILRESCRDLYGISEIKSIKLGIKQTDRDRNNEYTSDIIEVSVSGGENNVDTTGTVAYDENEIRVIYKGIVGGESEYDSSQYVMLLVENKSGKTVVIDEDYGSFSLNGFMTSCTAYNITVGADECAVWQVEIPKSALDDSGVNQASDIVEIEFDIEIRDEDWSNKKEGTVLIKLK